MASTRPESDQPCLNQDGEVYACGQNSVRFRTNLRIDASTKRRRFCSGHGSITRSASRALECAASGQRQARRTFTRGVDPVKARQPLNSAAFGPDKLNAISEAFELAWGDVAIALETSPAREDARLTIATAVLEAATAASGLLDVEQLRRAGTLAITRKYPAAAKPFPAP
jgi:hypothetical protein